MCGIVGYIGKRQAAPILLEGLHRLEYRGYDSAGIAVGNKGKLRVAKRRGRVRELDALEPQKFRGLQGIAHTRWATHGEPSDANAHPHIDASGRYAVVHNGIVENAAALKAQLAQRGVVFTSETDTEVLAHLIALLDDGSPLETVVAEALRRVVGAYGLAVIDAERPDTLVVARNGSPIVLGIGDKEMFFASDPAALVRHTASVVHLDDGEIAAVRADGYETRTLDGAATTKTPSTIPWKDEAFDKGEFTHFMRKEIGEQADAVRRTLSGRLDTRFHTTHLGGIEMEARDLLDIRRVKILGCGAAYLSGRVGAHLIEQLARIPADAEPASEFRYRNAVIERDTLYIAVSQSGETFDTLAAVQEIKRKGGRIMGVVNVVGSTIARECGCGVYLHAGPEVAVVSTKTFTCTAVALALLAIHLGRLRDLSVANGAPGGGPAGAARPHRFHPRTRGRDRSACRALRRRRACVLRRPRRRPRHRLRRRAEAQGDQLPPCRGLSRLGAEARPAGADRAQDADGDRAAARRPPHEEPLHHRGDQGPRRAGDRHHPSRRAAGGRRCLRGARARARARSAAAQHPAAAARLSRRPAAWHRHRPAAQPGEVGDRRVTAD
jgi:glucosamine--fructose-6-phosphate aminotransferase (isomerizing)